jgi:hypothetical protein
MPCRELLNSCINGGMETTLHRQLKEHFCEPGARVEVPLGRYRIDVVNGDRLVEIQRSGLAAIRDKVNKLVCDGYQVDVVKPLVARKRLVKLTSIDGIVKSRRWSPLKATMLDVFDELLYFTRVFPHPNLRMLIPLVDVEEIRYPGHGRRRRKRKNDFEIKDRFMLDIHETRVFQCVTDLQKLLPDDLPKKFDTSELAAGLGVPRHQAQRIGYVMRKTGVAKEVGKRGNAIVYRLVTKRQAAAALNKKRPKVKRTIKFDPRVPTAALTAVAAKKPVKKRKTTVVKSTAKKAAKRRKKSA